MRKGTIANSFVVLLIACAIAYLSTLGQPRVSAQLPSQVELPCSVVSPGVISTPMQPGGQTYNASTGQYRQWECVDPFGNVYMKTTLAAGSGLPTILAYSVTTESSSTALTANTVTSVNSKAVTFPATGCPCRVNISWFQYATTSGASAVFDGFINDGSNIFADSEWTIPVNNGISGGGYGFSPVTYANNAVVTFTVRVQADATGVTAQATPFHATGQRNSRLEIAIYASN